MVVLVFFRLRFIVLEKFFILGVGEIYGVFRFYFFFSKNYCFFLFDIRILNKFVFGKKGFEVEDWKILLFYGVYFL